MKMYAADWVAFVLVVIGGLNWGLVGAFKYDLVAHIFGDMSSLSRVIYAVVGLATLWLLSVPFRSMGADAAAS